MLVVLFVDFSADKLLAARGAGQVRQKWPANFVKRTDSLRTCFNRAYDRQRALCEDATLIKRWFELVEDTKAKYGICDEDVYNFDEAGFIMGKITTQLVITGAERRGRLKSIQPLSDEYCAGLWKRRMPTELLWQRDVRVSRGDVPEEPQEIDRAPSWSWASVDGPVTLNNIYNESQNEVIILIEIRSCVASPATGDPFSEIFPGVIRLSGYLLKLQLRQPNSDTYWSAFFDGRWWDNTHHARIILDYKPQKPQEMFCLPIVLWFDGHVWYFEFLILEANGDENRTFRRYGIMEVKAKKLSVNNDSELQDTDSQTERQDWGSNWDLLRRLCDESVRPNEKKETILGAEAIEISIV
ncbi:hypothetical protein KJE20_13846 [Pyrenophora tritici-repentis]|nr:hypothetical protein KJE20_13846 [Pyrenophora tritici-repentis]